MKTFDQKFVERRVLVSKTCDLCGQFHRPHYDSDWNVPENNLAQTEVSCRVGNRWPEGGSATEFSADICPECFTTKLVPWLNGQGARISGQEISLD